MAFQILTSYQHCNHSVGRDAISRATGLEIKHVAIICASLKIKSYLKEKRSEEHKGLYSFLPQLGAKDKNTPTRAPYTQKEILA